MEAAGLADKMPTGAATKIKAREVAPAAGDVTGVVRNSHGDPATSAQVTAVPVSGSNAWMDRDYRQPFENQSASAKVDESTTPTVQLKLIER